MGICGSKPPGEPKPTASGVSEGVPPDVRVDRCVLTLKGHGDWVCSASFSPDGAKIVSASGDRTVRVWNAATGECELTLEGHGNWVWSASFSPDGAKIVSASDDRTVRVWNAPVLTPEQAAEAAEAAKAAAPTIAFSVVELTGKELPMTMLSALHTVAELKQAVAAASGTRAAQVRLVLKNEVLDDESKTLGEHGVEAGSQVHAVAGALG